MKAFGGKWTEKKLIVLKKYLTAYITILKKYEGYYKTAYIDAFAGSGYIKYPLRKKNNLFEYSEESINFIKGSTKIALEISPNFDKYIFIEQNENNAKELKQIIDNEHKHLTDFIEIKIGNANKEIKKICKKNWRRHRAIIFLDPYGMETEWSTIEAIAKTKAIDLWTLFPLGVSVNRMLTKDGNKIPEHWINLLDKLFGTHSWFSEFYIKESQPTLFGYSEKFIKKADFKKIAKFYIHRLEEIFPGVVKEPMFLFNSTGNPIFMLCFATSNPKASKLAIKIAKEIIGKELKNE